MGGRSEALTPREEEILYLVAHGHSNKQIAGRLRIRPKTVEVHLSRISRKMKAASRVSMAVLAVVLGLVQVRQEDIQTTSLDSGL